MEAKKLSKANQSMIKAFEAGYRCNDSGRITRPDGSSQKLSDCSGYKAFGVWFNNVSSTILAHRFIMFCRVGEKMFTKGLMVLHRDDNPENNSSDNLYLGTRKDNARDAIRNNKTVKSGTYKHLYDEIYNYYLVFGQKKTYTHYNINQKTLVNIVNKFKNGKHTASSQISIPF